MQGSQPLWQQSSNPGSVGGVGCGSAVVDIGMVVERRKVEKRWSHYKTASCSSLRQRLFAQCRRRRKYLPGKNKLPGISPVFLVAWKAQALPGVASKINT